MCDTSWHASRHVRVHPRCGACAFPFSEGEEIVALVNNDLSPAGSFKPSAHADNTHGRSWTFCRIPECRKCATAPESATVHIDCLKLCTRHTRGTGTFALWRAATWRNAWRGAPSVGLLPIVDVAGSLKSASCSGTIAKLLLSLPPEIVDSVYKFSQEVTIWRLQSALNLALALPELRDAHLWRLPIDQVAKWDRHTGLHIKAVSRKEKHYCRSAQLVRIAVDAGGLRSIDRLEAEEMRLTSSRSKYLAYVIEDPVVLSNVEVEFRRPLARLRLPPKSDGFRIWDTSFPPSLWSCRVDPTLNIEPCRLRTIVLRDCTGITFFVSAGSTWAIHGHTRQEPFAEATLRTLPLRRQQSALWIYVPLPYGIAALWWKGFGAQTNLQTRFVLRRELERALHDDQSVDDVYIGPPGSANFDDVAATQKPLVLAYKVPELGPISSLWAYSNTIITPIPAPTIAITDKAPFRGAYFSSASLDNVVELITYHDFDAGECKGVAFRYSDGSERNVGQCRWGLDKRLVVTNPTCLCCRRQSQGDLGQGWSIRVVKVSAATARAHSHDEGGWNCFAMSGTLKCWFNHKELHLCIAH